ncbi:MAG: hypothetical protein P8181_14065, partial [bacterium]
FRSIVFAGFAAGYLMFFLDMWFSGLFGLFGIFPGTSNAWWMLQHHIDSIIFALVFAWPAVYTRLPGGGWLKGLAFGLLWAVAYFIVSTITGQLGAELFQRMPLSFAAAISALLLHALWGFFLGVLYVPPQQISAQTAEAG